MERYSLGEFEEVVMLVVAVCYQNAYGVAIKEEIEKRLQRRVSVGAMRSALQRLERKGYLQSHLGEATAVRGGKRKRYYEVTLYGKRALEHVMRTRIHLWEAIPSVAFEFK